MFQCQQCNKTSPPRTRMNRIIIEKRERTYYSVIVKHKIVKNPRFLQFESKDVAELYRLDKLGWKLVHETFSKGTEIVSEKRICKECYDKNS